MMIDRIHFGIVGGDQRQTALADSIAGDGFTVYACGFDNAVFDRDVRKADLKTTAAACDVLLLPLPVTMDGKTLKAVYAASPIPLDEDFAALLAGRQVFGGMVDRAEAVCPALCERHLRDYYAREEFALRNAAVTAEGALEYAMHEYPGTLCGSRCLVAGFGRIGSQLTPRLRALGASVTVAARRPEVQAEAEMCGCAAMHTDRLREGGDFDIVFNTVPSVIFTRGVLSGLRRGTLLIDLSSAPGGVDMDAAQKLGIHALHAFSLPAKVAPRTAGEIIKQTVYNMLRE